ncbi:hypothetical protein, partial [Pseudomonas syringae]|uniref:hypothetical protein n=1 Tax=Pseudomonas syringae TaxID=317 RepID=UPI001C1F265D
ITSNISKKSACVIFAPRSMVTAREENKLGEKPYLVYIWTSKISLGDTVPKAPQRSALVSWCKYEEVSTYAS